jgi:hypothetical protein
MESLTIWFVSLVCLTPTVGFAQSWSGYLVDSRCYDAEQRSFNPFDGPPDLVRDRGLEIRICTPSAKTKSFAVVESNEMKSFKLDPHGNERASALVRKIGKKSFREVTVTGERKGDVVAVNSISDAK